VKSARGVRQGCCLSPNLLILYNKYLTRQALEFFFTTAPQPIVGEDLLTIEDSCSHSDTPHSAGLLWTSDQTDAETYTWQHTTLKRGRHSCLRRDSSPQCQQASGRRPKSWMVCRLRSRRTGKSHVTHVDNLVLLANEETVIQGMIDRKLKLEDTVESKWMWKYHMRISRQPTPVQNMKD